MLIESVLKSAVEEEKVPFVVGMTGNSSGVTHKSAFGTATAARAVDADTVFRIFSMTKAVGGLAAAILVDRGKLKLDTPVGDVLDTWNELQVLDGFDGEEPVLRAPRTTATLRHLVTHTSGLEYEFWNSDVPRYMELTGHPTILSGLKSSLKYPLTSDPGTRWGYGPSTDWLGQMIEAADGRRIDVFCQEEIFEPLAMASTAFEPERLHERLADVHIRGEDGKFAPMELAPPSMPEVYGMGHALYSTPNDYMRFLRMILNGGQLDGSRVLSEDGLATMLGDQMSGLKFQTMVSCSPITADVVLPDDTTHSMIATLHTSDVPGKRSAGTQSWAGVCNTHYWVDPGKDLAAVIMTQSLPFVEPPFMETYDAFERAVYAVN
ncbi:serine hydrolase domain-containing protein [Roseibium sp. HPY-6]|uniref:serine hydrolase domain-containing protein n=1 Tax=Roseibium sp. HPY-6 TaxID=3229852 RepID=UPI00338FA2D5